MSATKLSLVETPDLLENADRLWHLKQSGLMEGLSLSELRQVAAHCTDLVYKRNKVVFNEGSKADYLAILNRGSIRLLVGSATGKDKIIELLTNGDVFGEDVIGPDGFRQSHAVAHQESWISILPRNSLNALLPEIPQFSVNLIRLLNSKLKEAREEIEDLSYSDTEKRIARKLIQLSKSHGKSVAARQSFLKLKIQITHESMAQLIGANRPHVSSIMSEFKKNGWIRYERQKLLVNAAELSRRLAVRN